MGHADNPERKRVLYQALSARTRLEIDAATHALRLWVAEHPDDLGIVDAFEQLSLLEEIVSQQGAEEPAIVKG